MLAKDSDTDFHKVQRTLAGLVVGFILKREASKPLSEGVCPSMELLRMEESKIFSACSRTTGRIPQEGDTTERVVRFY